MKILNLLTGGVAALALTASAHATAFTMTSPTSKGALPSGVSEIGGVVVDMVGTNGNRLVAQRSAAGLLIGYGTTNPFLIGSQTGLVPGVMSLLGGGITELAVRITLDDGDTAAPQPGNFDFNDNFLQLNGITFANFSSVQAQQTNSTGTTSFGGFSGGGFRNNQLDTGWFYSNSGAFLTSVYNSILLSGKIDYQLFDNTPGDNYYNFSAGINASLLNVEFPPPPPPPTSVPDGGSTLALLGAAFSAAALLRRRFSV